MNFNDIKFAVQRQFNEMKKGVIFRSSVDKDKLWELYLASFPEGTNPMFRERTEHDCQCCRSFIRNAGTMVSIVDNKLVSIWDINIGGAYQIVADALSEFVKQHDIENIFLNPERVIGTDKNYQDTDNGMLTFEHFYIQLPNELYCKGEQMGTKLGEHRTTAEMLKRALAEISNDAIDTVLELISQNSLYRGSEHTHAVKGFQELKKKFDTCSDRDLFCWSNYKASPAISRIRNTVIGTLLVDLSEGVELERAVSAFEVKVAPTNYKRPTALVTKAMVDNAKAKIKELGLEASLERRFATLEDISVNNVLFADRNARKRMSDVFDEIPTKAKDTKSLSKVEEMDIEQFIANVLPKIDSMEVFVENRHSGNLVSLIAPADLTAKNLFKWGNPFSWSYNGDVADSMKERVKEAGGKVDGVLRFSIMWSGDGKDNSDLDAHCKEPTGHIYYGSRHAVSGGNLDVDITQPVPQCNGKPAVENITWPSLSRMKDGAYEFYVNQFRAQGSTGFSAEIEFDGQLFQYEYPRAVAGNVKVATVTLNNGVFTIKHHLDSMATSKEMWNIKTQDFHPVALLSLSPNYWDEKAVGNKHYFFMLDGCQNDGQARGFYNEFLTPELDTHRKVLEIVGSKMKTDVTDNQLSGLGFSSTQKNSVLVRVKGSFTRTLKVNF